MAPSWDPMGVDDASVRQQPYIEITRNQYRNAVDALAGIVAPR